MTWAIRILVGLVAFLHLYFWILESFLWRGPVGQRVFRMDAAKAETTGQLAFNQGFYNAFLAAGLIWSFFAGAALEAPLRIFFFGCVVAAGIVGGLSVSRRILLIQALPAAIGLALVLAPLH